VVKSDLTVADAQHDDQGEMAMTDKPSKIRKAVPSLDPEIFGDVNVEISVTLGRGTMTVSEIANLESGAVVPLQTPLNAWVDILFKDRIVARGEIVSVGDNFGVRITEIAARNR
jgi:flagellar motor switch protein FliN